MLRLVPLILLWIEASQEQIVQVIKQLKAFIYIIKILQFFFAHKLIESILHTNVEKLLEPVKMRDTDAKEIAKLSDFQEELVQVAEI